MKRFNKIAKRLVKKANNENLHRQVIDYIKSNWEDSKWNNNCYVYYLDEIDYVSTIYWENYSSQEKIDKMIEEKYDGDEDEFWYENSSCTEYLFINYDERDDTLEIVEAGWNNDEEYDYSDNSPEVKKECGELETMVDLLADENDAPESIVNKIINKYKNVCKLDTSFLDD